MTEEEGRREIKGQKAPHKVESSCWSGLEFSLDCSLISGGKELLCCDFPILVKDHIVALDTLDTLELTAPNSLYVAGDGVDVD